MGLSSPSARTRVSPTDRGCVEDQPQRVVPQMRCVTPTRCSAPQVVVLAAKERREHEREGVPTKEVRAQASIPGVLSRRNLPPAGGSL